MFGYVRPSLARLSEEDRGRFSAAYCGLCRVLGQRYGQVAHPRRGRDLHPANEALELAADESVSLAWWQIQAALADPGRGKWKYRAAARALRGAYRRARALRPAFDRTARSLLAELRAMEEARCPSLDEPAGAFARILAAAAAESGHPIKGRVLEQLLYHLGRWIYLVDAADDLAEDFASGSYNPLICRFGLERGELTEEARESLTVSLDHSIRLMGAAFELWAPIVRSTVYEGLFHVGTAVLEGTFQANDMAFRITGRDKEQL